MNRKTIQKISAALLAAALFFLIAGLASVNAEGAEQAAVRYYQVGYPNQINYENIVVSNGSLKGSAYLYGSGSVYTFSFTVKRDGVWSPWSGGIEVTLE